MNIGRSHLAALLIAMLALFKYSCATFLDKARVPDEFRKNLVDVGFVDEKRGWAVGGTPFDDIKLFSKPTNLILETQDGGQSWFQRTL